MTRHFIQCSFCACNTTSHPQLSFFGVNTYMKNYLKVKSDANLKICEIHFDPCDVKIHGQCKRLVNGALPYILPTTHSSDRDHDYLRTTLLDMV